MGATARDTNELPDNNSPLKKEQSEVSGPIPQTDFMAQNFDEDAFRSMYGLSKNESSGFDDSYISMNRSLAKTKKRSSQSFLTDEANNSHQSICYSDDHFEAKVKRENLIGFFLQGVEMDKYITTHLYGDANRRGNPEEDWIEQDESIIKLG